MEFLEEIEINGGIIHCEDTLIIGGESAIVSHIIINEGEITLCFTDGDYYDGLNDTKLEGNTLIEKQWVPYTGQTLEAGMKIKTVDRIRKIEYVHSDCVFCERNDRYGLDKIYEILTF